MAKNKNEYISTYEKLQYIRNFLELTSCECNEDSDEVCLWCKADIFLDDFFMKLDEVYWKIIEGLKDEI